MALEKRLKPPDPLAVLFEEPDHVSGQILDRHALQPAGSLGGGDGGGLSHPRSAMRLHQKGTPSSSESARAALASSRERRSAFAGDDPGTVARPLTIGHITFGRAENCLTLA